MRCVPEGICRDKRSDGCVSVVDQEAEAVTALGGKRVCQGPHPPQTTSILVPELTAPNALCLISEPQKADHVSFFKTLTTMALGSFNPCFPLSRRTGTIVVSGLLIIFGFVFMVLCLSQLSGECAVSVFSEVL